MEKLTDILYTIKTIIIFIITILTLIPTIYFGIITTQALNQTPTTLPGAGLFSLIIFLFVMLVMFLVFMVSGLGILFLLNLIPAIKIHKLKKQRKNQTIEEEIYLKKIVKNNNIRLITNIAETLVISIITAILWSHEIEMTILSILVVIIFALLMLIIITYFNLLNLNENLNEYLMNKEEE